MADIDQLRAFAQGAMNGWPEDQGLDGFDLQDLAEKHGLLKLKDPKPTEPCGEHCWCEEYHGDMSGGVNCYIRTPLLLGNAGVDTCEGKSNG